MRTISIFLDYSVLETITLKSSGLHRYTIELLKLCKGERKKYNAFYSVVSLYELENKISSTELIDLLAILNFYEVKLVLHEAEKEVDFFAINVKHREKLKIKSDYDLYNIAAYAVTSIEEYVTWNQFDMIKSEVRESLSRDYIANGYRRPYYFDFRTPLYYIMNSDCDFNMEEIAKFVREDFILLNDFEYKYSYIQQDWFRNTFTEISSILVESIPSKHIREKRVPRADVDLSSDIVIDIDNFKDEIESKEIPLLRFDNKDVGFDMDYEFFKIGLVEGYDVLKRMLDDILFHRPVREEIELSEDEYKQLKIKELFDKLIPVLQMSLDGEIKNYPTHDHKYTNRFPIINLDSELTNSFLNLKGRNIYKVKRESIDFVEKYFAENLNQYWGFKTCLKWTELHDYGEGAADARNSIFLIDKNGENMYLILIHCFID